MTEDKRIEVIAFLGGKAYQLLGKRVELEGGTAVTVWPEIQHGQPARPRNLALLEDMDFLELGATDEKRREELNKLALEYPEGFAFLFPTEPSASKSMVLPAQPPSQHEAQQLSDMPEDKAQLYRHTWATFRKNYDERFRSEQNHIWSRGQFVAVEVNDSGVPTGLKVRKNELSQKDFAHELLSGIILAQEAHFTARTQTEAEVPDDDSTAGSEAFEA